MTKSSARSLSRELTAPEDVHAWILAQLPAGASLTDLSLFCTCDLPDRVLCLISFGDADANEIAGTLRGQTFGFNSAVVTLPVHGTFSCRCRPPGAAPASRSCSCRLVGQPASSWLDRD